MFEPKEIGLSYFTCVFLVARPFCRYQNVWLRDLHLDFWHTALYFWKKLNIGNNVWTKKKKNGAFIFHMCISCGKTFLLGTKRFYLGTFTLTFNHTFWTKSYRALILHISIPCDKTFLLIPIYILPSGIDLDFDLILEKLELVSAGGISPVRTNPNLVFLYQIVPFGYIQWTIF